LDNGRAAIGVGIGHGQHAVPIFVRLPAPRKMPL